MTKKQPAAAVRDYLAAIGRKGGKQKSAAKTAAVTENAKRPRPNAKGKPKPRRKKEQP